MNGYAEMAFGFFSAFTSAVILYIVAGRLAAKGRGNGGKRDSYACGERYPPVKPRLTILFVSYALAFLLLDVVAMVFAFSIGLPLTPTGLAVALTYLFVLLISVRAVICR